MNNCNCNPGPCDKPSCGGNRCGDCERACKCPAPYLGIEQLPDNISVLRFNLDGKRADYDFANLIYQNQTDTTLVVDVIKRLLVYSAERHTDSLTAAELGAIFHLADLGDVSTEDAEDGSFLVYQKNNNCGNGCVGLQDSWKTWNALASQVNSATYPFAFDATGKSHVLERPASPNQYYQLGWNAGNQLSYSQVPIVDVSRVVGADGKKIALYLDPSTNQIVGVKE